MTPLVISLLGSSFPADQFVEDALLARLPVPVERYADLLAKHVHGPLRHNLAVRQAFLARVLAGRPARSTTIVGRSSGALVATRLAAEGAAQIRGIVALSYPFQHPDRGAEPERTEHLARLAVPTLILQGRRDAYGGAEAATRYPMSGWIRVEPMDCGHDMRLDPAGWDRVAGLIGAFMGQLVPA